MKERFYDIYITALIPPCHLGNLGRGNPKLTALTQLENIHLLHSLGIPQILFPPHERPHLPTLRTLGFAGTDCEIISQCMRESPELLSHFTSSAFVNASNWATYTPSCDTQDQLAHITIANLLSHPERVIEASFTLELFRQLTNRSLFLMPHSPLPSSKPFGDEGSANHFRFTDRNGSDALHLLVYGYRALSPNIAFPKQHPARQSLETLQAIVRSHLIPQERVVFAQLDPHAIDAGISHANMAVIQNKNVLIYHTDAFVGTEAILNELQEKIETHLDTSLQQLAISPAQLSFKEAATTRFFNSLLIELPDHSMQLIAPKTCQEHPKTKSLIEEIVQNPSLPITHAIYVDDEAPSLHTHKISLNAEQIQLCHRELYLDTILYREIKNWIHDHYPETFSLAEYKDTQSIQRIQQALHLLSEILNLHTLYSFQK